MDWLKTRGASAPVLMLPTHTPLSSCSFASRQNKAETRALKRKQEEEA